VAFKVFLTEGAAGDLDDIYADIAATEIVAGLIFQYCGTQSNSLGQIKTQNPLS
jgi:hypothetical protein